MNIIFFGKGERGIVCLKALLDNHYKIDLIVLHPEENTDKSLVIKIAKKNNTKYICPDNPNSNEIAKLLIKFRPDLFILAGYGKILKLNIISLPKIMSINLHGGKLPEYRGSSPLNWAIINGERSFNLSIIKIDSGIDTGDILMEQSFKISKNHTIKDSHEIANKEFPKMLLDVVSQIQKGYYELKQQDNSKASYYPLRFPEDGFILWDMLTAEQIHNRIRALTNPYPCAFTFIKKRKVILLSSQYNDINYCGESGRVYKKSKNKGLLVCASDKCLWINEAIFEDTQAPIFNEINIYDKFVTVGNEILSKYLL